MQKKYKDLMYYKFCAYGFLKNQRYYSIFFILFLRSIGFSFLQIGLLISIREISIQILEIPTGVIADIFGRRKSMLASFGSYIISFTIFYFSKNFLAFSIAMIIFAFGETFRSGTHKAMIMQYLDMKGISDKKLEYYGGTRGSSQLGSAVSSLIAASMVFFLGDYRSAFLFTLIPYSLDFLLMLTYPKYLDGERSKEKKSLRLVYTHIKDTFVNIVKSKNMFKLLINSSFSNSTFSVSKEYLQPIIKMQALSLGIFLWMTKFQRVSLIVGILYFGIYLFSSWASRNSSRLATIFGKKDHLKSADILYLINALTLLIVGLSFNLSLLWISIAMFFVLHFIQNGRRPMLVNQFGDIMDKNERATVLSIDSLINSFITSFMAILIGSLADSYGIGAAFLIYGLISFAVFPFIKLKNTRITGA